MTLSRFFPLAGFVVPTLLIGYGVVIPRSCIAGWNELKQGDVIETYEVIEEAAQL